MNNYLIRRSLIYLREISFAQTTKIESQLYIYREDLNSLAWDLFSLRRIPYYSHSLKKVEYFPYVQYKEDKQYIRYSKDIVNYKLFSIPKYQREALRESIVLGISKEENIKVFRAAPPFEAESLVKEYYQQLIEKLKDVLIRGEVKAEASDIIFFRRIIILLRENKLSELFPYIETLQRGLPHDSY